jgi:hypothetical protein
VSLKQKRLNPEQNKLHRPLAAARVPFDGTSSIGARYIGNNYDILEA